MPLRLFLSVICLAFTSLFVSAQKVAANKSMIQKVLQTQYDCNIIVEDISDYLQAPYVRCFGGGYMSSDLPSVVITFVVEKDSNGSKYRRILYIPANLKNKESFSDEDFCFFEDHWKEGPHFDTQGGKYPATTVTKQILEHIKLTTNHR